ncbi:MAG: hypothetical protein ACRDAM_08605 [Casimicrobium sp.]
MAEFEAIQARIVAAEADLNALSVTAGITEAQIDAIAVASDRLTDAAARLNDALETLDIQGTDALNAGESPRLEAIAAELEALRTRNERAQVIEDAALDLELKGEARRQRELAAFDAIELKAERQKQEALERLRKNALAVLKAQEAAVIAQRQALEDLGKQVTDTINGVGAIAGGANSIISSGGDRSKIISGASAIAGQLGDVLGAAVGVPFIGEIVRGIGNALPALIDLAESIFDPLAAKVRELANELKKSLSGAYSSSIFEAIKSGDSQKFADNIGGITGETLLKAIIDAFVQSALIEGVLSQPLSAFARALATPDPSDDAAARDNLRRGIETAKQVYGAAAPELERAADELGVVRGGSSSSANNVSFSPELAPVLSAQISNGLSIATQQFDGSVNVFGVHVGSFGGHISRLEGILNNLEARLIDTSTFRFGR